MNYYEFISAICNSDAEEWNYDDDLGRYIFKGDIRIAIVSDRSNYITDDDDNFYEDWARNFPDPNAKRKRYFLQFNGSTIEAFYTAAVDGYRCYIPYPRTKDLTITDQQYRIARVINGVFVGHDLDTYLQRAKITLRDS